MDLSGLRVPPHLTRQHATAPSQAIITCCVPPKVVGEVTSSVTATGVPEAYGLRRRAGTT